MEKRVVITGIGVISPIGIGKEAFFDGLKSGRCGIDFITKFDTADLKVKIAAEVKDFSPASFMEKGEIRRTDLFAQYALGASIEAMTDSNLAGNIVPERLGVYFSSGIGGMNTFDGESRRLAGGGPTRVSPYFISSMIGNMASGLVAIRHDARGPSLCPVTACASSTNSIGEAYRAIKHGYADAIIAGGSEATVHPLAVAGFNNCMALTERNDPTSASIPFDKRRDGFVMGEGAGALILEEYEHAKKRDAKIYAEVIGYGNTCDANHVTAPRGDGLCAAAAITCALSEANMLFSGATGTGAGGQPAAKPEVKREVLDGGVYINAHGTSTPLNDKCETAAIKLAMGEGAYKTVISSTKSMLGHCLGAAGALEAVACIMALTENVIPPTINLSDPDPECDLYYVPNEARLMSVNYALSLSFGFGGHNAVIAFKKIQN